MAEKKVPYGDRKWRDELYVEVHKLARMGKSDQEISQIIGVGRGVFDRWKKDKPAFSKALLDARDLALRKEEEVTRLYSRLPAELQDLWDRIQACEPESKDQDKEVIRDKRRLRIKLDQEVEKLELRGKQRLYLFALMGTDYNGSEACRLTGLDPSVVRGWLADKQFAELHRYVQDSKKDLYESALVGLVKQGEPSAVVFANKTLNRDRGYNDKVETNLNVNVTHSLDDLGLSLEERKKLLEAVRLRNEQKLLVDRSKVIDADFEVKK